MFEAHVISCVDGAVKAARRVQDAAAARERGRDRGDVESPLAPALAVLAQLASAPGAERWVPPHPKEINDSVDDPRPVTHQHTHPRAQELP
eukprot:6476977-Pyramimonas_sp.AAC.2